jgi:hypothetical protein
MEWIFSYHHGHFWNFCGSCLGCHWLWLLSALWKNKVG